MFFGTGQKLVTENDLCIALVRHKILGAVLGDVSSKAFTHIQQTELCPEVHQAIAAGSAGQSDNAFYLRPNLHKRLKAF